MWQSRPRGPEIIGKNTEETRGFFAYTDALRTVHLICCQSLTVSACLTDNMAKGIHLEDRQ